METKSIMIVGVGGQGSLLASRLLGNVLLAQGYDARRPKAMTSRSPRCTE